MGDTTLSISDETRERLDNYRGGEHGSVDDVLNGLMHMVPTVEEIQDGCDFVDCDKHHIYRGTPEDTGGFIEFFYAEEHDVRGVMYFCSAECAKAAVDRRQARMPHNPDRVLVGGRGELRAEFEDATYHFEGKEHSVLIPVPGAFTGTSSVDHEYDYVGEPVYICNEGDVVQMYVVEEIVHEETHTALLLGHDYPVTMLAHPDDEQRELYEEEHEKIEAGECNECKWKFHYRVQEPPETCPRCDTENW